MAKEKYITKTTTEIIGVLHTNEENEFTLEVNEEFYSLKDILRNYVEERVSLKFETIEES